MHTKERTGEYKGYHYAVVMTDMGHRCGYVAVPKGHPAHGYEEYNHHDEAALYLHVHGGVTFSCVSDRVVDEAWTIGFDCAHWGDDPITCSTDYVEAECKHLIDQLAELGEPS